MSDKVLLAFAVAGWAVAFGVTALAWKLSRIIKGAFDGLGLR